MFYWPLQTNVQSTLKPATCHHSFYINLFVLNHGCNSSFPAHSSVPCCFCPLGCPLAPPAAGCRLARFGRGEGDALRVQVVHQFGGTQADPCCFESLLELGQDQRLVLEDLTVQSGVRQDQGAHRPEAVLEAVHCLGGRDAAIAV